MLRFLPALWKANRWIDATVTEYRSRARAVQDFGFERLRLYFSDSLLSRAKVVVIDRTPRPPVEHWVSGAADELGHLPGESAAGITFRDTFFVRTGREHDESLFFHELVHVVQWQHLGPMLFLLLYGIFLLRHGYVDSPLETMAYELQDRFDERSEPFDVEAMVRERTDGLLARFKQESLLHRALAAMLA